MIRKTLNSSPFIVLLMIDLFVMTVSFLVLYLLLGKILLGNRINYELLLASGEFDIVRWLLLWYSISLFFIPALILAWIFAGKKWKSYLQVDSKIDALAVIVIIILAIVAQISVNFLVKINMNLAFPEELKFLEDILRRLEENTNDFIAKILYTSDIEALIMNLLIIALAPALSEELFFRGIIQTQLHQKVKNYHIAVLISAIIFAFAHFQFFTFLPRVFLGLILGYLFYYLNSIWANVLFHFLNNSFGVITYFYLAKEQLSIDLVNNPDALNIPNYTYAISFFVVFVLLWFLKFYKNKW